MVNNPRSASASISTTDKFYKDHNQCNKQLIMNKHCGNNLTIFHQNICGLLNKKDELLNSVTRNPPQIICITEHHLIDEELEVITFHPYTLGAKYCRRIHKCGGVCILIQDNIHYTTLNVDRYSSEKDIKICAMKLHISSYAIVNNNSLQVSNRQYYILFK